MNGLVSNVPYVNTFIHSYMYNCMSVEGLNQFHYIRVWDGVHAGQLLVNAQMYKCVLTKVIISTVLRVLSFSSTNEVNCSNNI